MTLVRRLSAGHKSFAGAWQQICDRGLDSDRETEAVVRKIIADVRNRGDEAVAEYTERFEGRLPGPDGFEIAHSEVAAAWERCSPEIRRALTLSADRIREFHREQGSKGYQIQEGRLRLRVSPLQTVGLYVPGGTALYPSSVLMTAIPAIVAGVKEIVMVTPGASDQTLAAAHVAGVHRVFEIGGAQAVAALAYGTERIPRVHKIVGPGNKWVAAAKRQVFGQVDIDSVAGPSEVLVIADGGAMPHFVAADLLAQAEHDVEARCILLSDSEELLNAVDVELERQIADLPRRDIAEKSLREHGAAILISDLDDAFELSDDYAPEHLELALDDAEDRVSKVQHAGAIFVGHYSPEAAGDYSAGPNHVLPTASAARYASPLGVYDFLKYTSILAMSREDLAALREPICALAEVEGLHAHGRSVAIRFEHGVPEGSDE
ncbi:MAG: histidinol dehydrogenase [Myxococcales bacterium]|nr:histidinol dehydrogenase [Myxococcales bacterium]